MSGASATYTHVRNGAETRRPDRASERRRQVGYARNEGGRSPNWPEGRGADGIRVTNDLAWLQEWYRAQCNDEWEHSYGVRIDTLDNPGWSVTIDLKGTQLEHVEMTPVMSDNGPDNWVQIRVENSQFVGYGDSQRLLVILATFREWAQQVSSGTVQPK
jgi:hypothetical protein